MPDIEWDADDRFYRDLNPQLHFAPDGDGGLRVASVCFKDPMSGPSYRVSTDAGRMVSLDEAFALRQARGRSGWGTGSVQHRDVTETVDGHVEHSPTRENPAHCDILIEGSKKKFLGRLAARVQIHAFPTDEIRTG